MLIIPLFELVVRNLKSLLGVCPVIKQRRSMLGYNQRKHKWFLCGGSTHLYSQHWEVEAGGSLWVQGQPDLKTEFQDRLQNATKKPCLEFPPLPHCHKKKERKENTIGLLELHPLPGFSFLNLQNEIRTIFMNCLKLENTFWVTSKIFIFFVTWLSC